MSPLRYKTLLTYLPGMASVVNAFDSPQVQNSVYEALMEALDIKLETEGLGAGAAGLRPAVTQLAATASGELTHDLIEGESIHADPRRMSNAASTVF